MNSDAFRDHAVHVLERTTRELTSGGIDTSSLIRVHVWRDSDYVGIADGHVATWRGVSLNLGRLQMGLKGLYVDKVANTLPERERMRLFGEDFASAIRDYSEFVVIFGTGFRTAHAARIKEHGLIPRRLPNALHACYIAGVQRFLATPVDECSKWAMTIAQLQHTLVGQP